MQHVYPTPPGPRRTNHPLDFFLIVGPVVAVMVPFLIGAQRAEDRLAQEKWDGQVNAVIEPAYRCDLWPCDDHGAGRTGEFGLAIAELDVVYER